MFLPTSLEEMKSRGWDQCDFILITPDAYIDHPSFAMAILGRFLEKHGFKVGILSQPKWQDPQSFLALGEPKLAWGISGGNMDSMVLNYTASKKRRKEDLYSEGGNPFFPGTEASIKNKIRPDRVLTVYANQLRQVSKNKPVIIGGIEASLRRLAHYDYWANKVKRSVLFDTRADILIYGMGELSLLAVLQNLEKEVEPSVLEIPGTAVIRKELNHLENLVELPSFEECSKDKAAFAESFKLFLENHQDKTIVQKQDTRYLVQFPHPSPAPSQLDSFYDLPFERQPHPKYKDIPAYRMIRDSVNTHRGCYGNCSFCSITIHQGSKIVSRSEDSILSELKAIVKTPGFKGTVSDLGGPSANMYASFCAQGGCGRPNCLRKGKACPQLRPGLKDYVKLLRKAGKVPGINHVHVSSGLRFDPVLMDEAFLAQILKFHTPGSLKIAPESGSDRVLSMMNKPPVKIFEKFYRLFRNILKKENIHKKLVPYILIGHPGETETELNETRSFLKNHQLSGKQYQTFTPTPMTLASCIYYTRINPFTGKAIPVENDAKVLESWKLKLTGEEEKAPAKKSHRRVLQDNRNAPKRNRYKKKR